VQTWFTGRGVAERVDGRVRRTGRAPLVATRVVCAMLLAMLFSEAG
jgi:hypothetical protein